MYVLVYVDDIIVASSDSTLTNPFVHSLSTCFLVKNLGPLHYFLGVEITCTSSGLFFFQSKYIFDLLHRTNMQKSKAVTTPMSVIDKLTTLDGNSFEDPQWYRSVVGNLQYLSFTKPDISFAVNRVCHCIFLGSHLIYWSSKKQPTIARSSMEAGYKSLANTTCELL